MVMNGARDSASGFNILLPNHNIKRMKKVLKKTLKSTAQKSSGWAGALYPFFVRMGTRSLNFGTFILNLLTFDDEWEIKYS